MGILPVVLVVVFGLLAPKWSRPGFWFGVAVPRGFEDSSEGRSAARAYRARLLGLGVLALLALAVASPSGVSWLSGVAPFLALAGLLWGYFSAHRKVRAHALPVRSDEGPPAGVQVGPTSPIRFVWQLGPFLILGAAAAYLALHWSEVPSQYPTHWNARGEVNGWSHKSVLNAFWPAAFGAVLCFVFAAMADLLRKTTRAPGDAVSAGIQDAQRQLSARLLLGTEYFFALLMGGITLLPLVRDSASLGGRMAWAPILYLCVLAFLLIRYGRRVQKVRQQAPAPEGEDLHWRWGLFYVNRNDPAVMVPKRFSFGFTLNFGNKMSWIVMALLLAPALVAVVAAIASARS